MEKLVHRESVLLAHGGAGTQVFSENSPKTPYRNSEDLDFKDVFGGPPRCYSMQDVRLRYSFGETIEPEEENVTSPWNVLKEKPVFGEESITRIRNNSNDFFHDIFKGDESYISPRRTDRDRDSIFGSSPGSRIMSPGSRTMSPGSRIMSPARPLPPKAESFRTSLLAQFSLPEKLTKTMELPSFGSRNRTPSKMDGITIGSRSPCSPITASLSRFSSQTNGDQDDITNDARRTVYRQSPLSHGASFSSEDSSFSFMSDQKDGVENLKKDTKTVEPPQTYNQFHFSIYKWPERGVPMLFPLVNTNNLKSKDTNRNEKCAGSNGRIENENTKTNEGLSENMEPEPLELEREMRVSISKEDVKELKNNVEKSSDGIPESKSQSNTKDAVVLDRALKSAKAEVKSLYENDAREKSKKEVLLRMEESLESEVNTTHAALNDAIEQQGNVTEMKENKTITPKAANTKVNASKNLNKNEETGTHSNREDVDITSSMNKSRVKGKVKEFVLIFNQETDSRPKPDIQMRSQSNRWRTVNIDQTENHEATLNAAKRKEQVNLNSVEKRLAGSVKVDKNLNHDGVKQHFHTKSPDHVSTKTKSAVSSDSLTQDSKLSPQNADDDHFEDNFLVAELSVDHENITQNGDDSEYTTKVSDAKIHQWSIGKKGNIRSLLSTLQNVLWAGSGWKPVPLVDLIEPNSVKRAYQKALLYLHPDKLQQRGAASHQKYIAEKVFEILQEAWEQCNSLAHI